MADLDVFEEVLAGCGEAADPELSRCANRPTRRTERASAFSLIGVSGDPRAGRGSWSGYGS
jgi:hypothetical protein